MKYRIPQSPDEWIAEIEEAIDDAGGERLHSGADGGAEGDEGLFHLAPHVCLKFRGRPRKGAAARKVVEAALATYIANTRPIGTIHRLAGRPQLAFALCYVMSNVMLDIITEDQAQAIMERCEDEW